MAVNRGKDFEQQIKNAFLKVPDITIDRLPDPTSGYKGVCNICDFHVYKYPRQYYIECKSVHGSTLNFKANITKNQWEGLYEKSKVTGVVAGIIIWYVDEDQTVFMPIQVLHRNAEKGSKSVHVVDALYEGIVLNGKKKRVFFDYDMEDFFRQIEENGYGKD